MGRRGKQSGAIYQYVIPRAEKLTDSGMAVPETTGDADCAELPASWWREIRGNR
jgi:hypothetical protein